jgi:hypothetical protein
LRDRRKHLPDNFAVLLPERRGTAIHQLMTSWSGSIDTLSTRRGQAAACATATN